MIRPRSALQIGIVASMTAPRDASVYCSPMLKVSGNNTNSTSPSSPNRSSRSHRVRRYLGAATSRIAASSSPPCPNRRTARVAWCPQPSTSSGSGPVAQLGANAHGEVLVPGRVPDCYLGLLLDPPGDQHAGMVLVVAPASLLHPGIPQPDGTLLYKLVTGHPDRAPQELMFVADLTVELRAWPTDTWAKVGVDPQAAAGAVVAGWQRGDLLGLGLGGLSAEEALAMQRPAMTLVRAQLGDRLGRQLAAASRRWRPP